MNLITLRARHEPFSTFDYRSASWQVENERQEFGEEHAQTDADETQRRLHMKSSTKDKIQGAIHEAKGTVNEKVGQFTKDPNRVADGQDEKIAGKVQKKIGQIEKVFEK